MVLPLADSQMSQLSFRAKRGIHFCWQRHPRPRVVLIPAGRSSDFGADTLKKNGRRMRRVFSCSPVFVSVMGWLAAREKVRVRATATSRIRVA